MAFLLTSPVVFFCGAQALWWTICPPGRRSTSTTGAKLYGTWAEHRHLVGVQMHWLRHLHHRGPGQMGAGGPPAVREEAPSSNYGILFDTIASFAPLVFSFSSSRFLLFSEPLLSQNAKGSLFKSHWQDWNLCDQVVVILKSKLCLNQGCFCLFFKNIQPSLAGEWNVDDFYVGRPTDDLSEVQLLLGQRAEKITCNLLTWKLNILCHRRENVLFLAGTQTDLSDATTNKYWTYCCVHDCVSPSQLDSGKWC